MAQLSGNETALAYTPPRLMRRDWLALVWCLGLALALLAPALMPGKCLLAGSYAHHLQPWQSELAPPAVHQPGYNSLLWDSMAQYYPWRSFAHRSLQAGYVPLWNPHTLSGMPFVANFQSAVFYPLNLPFWLFDPARVFGWMALVHLVLAGLGTYFLARTLCLSRASSLASASAYELCGFLVTWLELPTLVYVASWLPWALAFAYLAIKLHRVRYAVLAGLVLGLQGLAGHPQIWLYSLLAVGCVMLFTQTHLEAKLSRRLALRLGALGLAFGLAGLIAAVQVLPSLELARHSHRTSGATLARFAAYRAFALPEQQLVEALLPNFFGRPDHSDYWGLGNLKRPSLVTGMYSEYCFFAGVLVLFLAGLALVTWHNRRVWALALVASLLLLLALGTWLNAPLFFLIPGMASSGGPNRIVILYLLVMALLAGFGVESLLARRARPAQLLAVAGTLVVLALALGGYALWRVLPLVPDAFQRWLATDAFGPVHLLLALAVGITLGWLCLKFPRKFFPRWVFALAIGAELLGFAFGFNPVCNRSDVYPPSPFVEAVRAAAGQGRLAVAPGAWRVDDFPRAVLPPNAALAYGLYELGGYDSLLPKASVEALTEACGHSPFVTTNGNMAFAWGPPDVLRQLGAAVFLEPGKAGAGPVFRKGTQPAVRVLARTSSGDIHPVPFHYVGPNSLKITLRGPAEAVLCSDSFYPGWHAWFVSEASRREVEISRDTLNRRVVQLPQTTGGTLRLIYMPITFRLGFYLALLACALLGALAAGFCWRKKYDENW